MRAADLLRLALLGAALAACQPADGRSTAREDNRVSTPRPTVVDSIRPIAEEVEMFRATLADHPTTLTGGAASIDALTEALAAAVNGGEARAMGELVVSRAEFAYFYYPHTHYTRPPYELAPALAWHRLSSRSHRGATRLLATFQERKLRLRPPSCAAPEALDGARFHHCSAPVLDAEGEWVDVRLFGPILESDGRFKFLTLANDL